MSVGRWGTTPTTRFAACGISLLPRIHYVANFRPRLLASDCAIHVVTQNRSFVRFAKFAPHYGRSVAKAG